MRAVQSTRARLHFRLRRRVHPGCVCRHDAGGTLAVHGMELQDGAVYGSRRRAPDA